MLVVDLAQLLAPVAVSRMPAAHLGQETAVSAASCWTNNAQFSRSGSAPCSSSRRVVGVTTGIAGCATAPRASACDQGVALCLFLREPQRQLLHLGSDATSREVARPAALADGAARTQGSLGRRCSSTVPAGPSSKWRSGTSYGVLMIGFASDVVMAQLALPTHHARHRKREATEPPS